MAVQRFAFLLLVLAAFMLMLLGKGETLLIDWARTGIVDAAAPVLDALSRPAATIAHAVEEARSLAALRTDNAELRRDNAQLHYWQATARRLAVENEALRALLNRVPEPRARFVTGRVIADSGGAFVRSVVINAGTRDGIAKGQAVMTGDGLIGRVLIAGDRSARVLLISDINSRIPVAVDGGGDRAVLVGDNSDLPKLAFLPANASVQVGQRIVTSGHDGLFPPGLAVGVVSSVTKAEVRIRPHVAFGTLEFVRVVDYLPIVGPPSEPAPRRARVPAR